MLILASITDPIVNLAVDVVDAIGLLGVFVLMVLESACIPVPSEATMLFAGFNVSDGQYSLFAAVAVGSFANLVGSWIAYAIGYYGRILPIIRTVISLPAGVARMPFWRFTAFTLLGCIPWVFMLTFIGKEAGDNWETWKDNLHYVDYAVLAAIVAAIVYFVVRWRRGKSDSGPSASTSGEPGTESV